MIRRQVGDKDLSRAGQIQQRACRAIHQRACQRCSARRVNACPDLSRRTVNEAVAHTVSIDGASRGERDMPRRGRAQRDRARARRRGRHPREVEELGHRLRDADKGSSSSSRRQVQVEVARRARDRRAERIHRNSTIRPRAVVDDRPISRDRCACPTS